MAPEVVTSDGLKLDTASQSPCRAPACRRLIQAACFLVATTGSPTAGAWSGERPASCLPLPSADGRERRFREARVADTQATRRFGAGQRDGAAAISRLRFRPVGRDRQAHGRLAPQATSIRPTLRASALWKPGLGACRAWGVDSENRPQRGQFLPDLQPHSPAMGRENGAKWTAAVDSKPTLPKPDRLLEPVLGLARSGWALPMAYEFPCPVV